MSERLDERVAESALRKLVLDRGDLVVASIAKDGRFAQMPESLGYLDAVVTDVGSPLELVDPSSRLAVLGAFDMVRTEGVGRISVAMQGGGGAHMHIFDLLNAHGVIVLVFSPVELDQVLPRPDTVSRPTRPRLGRARKDATSLLVDVDQAMAAMLCWTRDEIIGRRSIDLIHPDDQETAIHVWIDVLSSPGSPRRMRARHLDGDGAWRWIEITNRNLLDDPSSGFVECDVVDISDEMAAVEALREREELLQRMAGALPVAVCHFDLEQRVLYANDRLFEIARVEHGSSREQLLACIVDRAAFRAAILNVLSGTDSEIDVQIDRADGTGRRHCTAVMRTLSDRDGKVTGGIFCITDVTESRRLRTELETRATYDALTGCANRGTILALLGNAMAREVGGVAAVFVDLDGFKSVNDELGHAVGDTILIAAAARLREAVRAGDVIGRLGGDEFLAVCLGVPDEATAALVAARIADGLNGPLDVGGHRLELRASVGVGWVGSDAGGVDAEELIARADGAMYASKRAGDGVPVVAGGSSHDHVPVRRASTVELGVALRQAMDDGALEVHFQPIQECSGELFGYEALLRWRRDDRLVPAAEFIESAEATGLICEIGPWVVDEVCRQALAVRRTDLSWFINLSPRELAAPKTIEAVARSLDRHGLPPSSLVVEVTEHVALADGGVAAAVLAELADMGVRAAMDDFGTGWSSFASLLAVRAAWLKIDRRFVSAIETPNGAAIVAGVVDLARRLGIRTIAEGVETPAELAAVRLLGADCIQGYLLGRPGPLPLAVAPRRAKVAVA